MNIVQREKAPTPSFFKKVRTVGIALAAVGAAIVASPVALPVALVTVAGYLTVAGGVLTAVSQITTNRED